jgi:hypothetical protein
MKHGSAQQEEARETGELMACSGVQFVVIVLLVAVVIVFVVLAAVAPRPTLGDECLTNTYLHCMSVQQRLISKNILIEW